jgi:hypothetical protein
MGRMAVKAPKATFNPGNKTTAPVHDRRGPICNIAGACGRLAHYVHGSKAGCDKPEHKEAIFALCRKVRRADKVVLPEVSFEREDGDAAEEAWTVPEKIG